MPGAAATLRHELIGLAGVVERNVYLTRRYIYWDLAFFVWTVANTLTIVFIAKGIEASGGSIDVEQTTTAPTSRIVVTSLTSIFPPPASMPLAMKTIVRVFATVQRKNATSHQM